MESLYLGNVRSNTQNNSFKEQFATFSRLRDPHSDGKFISLSQSDEWMRQAHVFDDNITLADTHNLFMRLGEKVNLHGYNWFLQELARNKGIDVGDLRDKMTAHDEVRSHAESTPHSSLYDRSHRIDDLQGTRLYGGSDRMENMATTSMSGGSYGSEHTSGSSMKTGSQRMDRAPETRTYAGYEKSLNH